MPRPARLPHLGQEEDFTLQVRACFLSLLSAYLRPSATECAGGKHVTCKSVGVAGCLRDSTDVFVSILFTRPS